MAVKHLSYLDLSPEQRTRAATQARGRIKTMLANPFLTPDQVAHLRREQEQIGKWERGQLSHLMD